MAAAAMAANTRRKAGGDLQRLPNRSGGPTGMTSMMRRLLGILAAVTLSLLAVINLASAKEATELHR
ncbi:MAG: hypothetical protein R3D01_02190 [Hyphomicrobiales bacterium]